MSKSNQEKSTNSLGSFINYKQVVMTLANDLNRLKSFSNKLNLSK